MQTEKVSHALFIDLGTNGEMALISPEGNLCTATAAGPAFEGGFGGRMYGADVIAAVAELLRKEVVDEIVSLAEELEQRYPDCDINMISGEQPVYYYIISIE